MSEQTSTADPPALTTEPQTSPPYDAEALTADFDRAIELREGGSVVESRDLLRNVVRGRTAIEGGEGFDTQCALSQLARSLRALGEYEEATRLHRDVLRIRHRLYGQEHGYTLNSAGILIETLRMQGDIAAANEIERQYLSQRTASATERRFARPQSDR